MRSEGLVIDTIVCLTLTKWETVSGQFGGDLNDRDCEALRSGQRLRGSATKMGRRTHARMARQMPAARQGLGKSEPEGAHIPAPRIHQVHVEKAMQSRMMFADRL